MPDAEHVRPATGRPRTVRRAADLDLERSLLGPRCRSVAGMDEVGRGALAGPVAVGAAVVDARTRLTIPDLTDSKLLSPARRTTMAEQIAAWIPAAVGCASPREIDLLGITGALRLAGQRALARLGAAGHRPDAVLLDGSHDWLTAPAPDLFAEPDPVAQALETENLPAWTGTVSTRVKADVACASVAAASVWAKVHRDALMLELDAAHPGYGWAGNKGYGAAAHRRAIAALGPTPQHRLSWKLGTASEALEAARAARG